MDTTIRNTADYQLAVERGELENAATWLEKTLIMPQYDAR